MIVSKKQISYVEKTITEKVLCNGCQKDIWNGHTINGCKITFDFEFSSAFDGQLLLIHFCDDCFIKMQNSLQLPPNDLI